MLYLCMTENLRKEIDPPTPKITSNVVKKWKALCNNALSRWVFLFLVFVFKGLATIVEIVQKRFIEEI